MKSWTIMIYMNADQKDMIEYADGNLKEIINAGSSDHADVYLLIDRYKTGNDDDHYYLPHIYKIIKGRSLDDIKPVEVLPSENIGDPHTLRSFLGICKKHSPAEHYMLMFWDHGTGYGVAGSTEDKVSETEEINFRSASRKDPGTIIRRQINRSIFHYPLYKRNVQPVFRSMEISKNINDELHVTEIAGAIKKEFPGKKKIDIVSFDACWMQTMENAYTLSEVAHFIVASQNLISTDGLAYYSSLQYAGKFKGLPPEDLARYMVQCTYNKLRNDPITTGTTISAISGNQMDIIAGEMDQICEQFISNLQVLAPLVQKARFFCLSYYDTEDPIGYDLKVVDIIHLFQNIEEELRLAEKNNVKAGLSDQNNWINDLGTQITQFVNKLKLQLVVYHLEDSSIADRKPFQKNWGAQGINIFFPETLQEWNYYKSAKSWYFDISRYSMPFLKRKWKKFLTAYFKWMENGA